MPESIVAINKTENGRWQATLNLSTDDLKAVRTGIRSFMVQKFMPPKIKVIADEIAAMIDKKIGK